MTMKVTPLRTYWNTEEAATAIDFLDALRDALWEIYGAQITEMHREACDPTTHDPNQYELEFDDDILF